jgi:transcriptional regulator with XRE-family HTH domain
MTDSFGARLRRERERRKIDLADVAARTKIKASLFAALERNDASQWPTGLFRRSFMRAYAEAIGLDPQATVREFLEHFPDPADPPAERRPVAAATESEAGESASGVRLTLAEAGMPFQGGRFLNDARRRWAAVAWDTGALFAVALTLFVVVNRFWMPFGVVALCYYVGGILFLGNSPGVFLFAPKMADAASPTEPARAARPRVTEPGRVRHPESARNPFRSARRSRTTRT